MRLRSIIVCAALAALAWPAWPAGAQAPAQNGAKAEDIKLEYSADKDLQALPTPVKVLKPLTFAFSGPGGEITVGGAKVVVVARVVDGRQLSFGVDKAAAGKVDPADMVDVSAADTADYTISIPIGKDKKQSRGTAVSFGKLIVQPKNASEVAGFRGTYCAGGSYKGKIGGQAVRIIDDNLDGKITQDGSDAILIGDAPAAIPLAKCHAIGEGYYELAVTEDGGGLKATKAAPKVGAVDSALQKQGTLKAAVVMDSASGRAFDLARVKELPAGEYKLVYGLLAKDKEQVVFAPTAKSPVYAITPGMQNTLRIGPPLSIVFKAAEAEGKLSIQPDLAVLGSGNEQYTVVFNDRVTPQVFLLDGKEILSSEAMGFG